MNLELHKSKNLLKILNTAIDAGKEIQKVYKKSFNVEIIREPYQEHWGGFICTFQDYDENIVQFIQQSTND